MSIIDWALIAFFACGLASFIVIPAWSIWRDHRYNGPFEPDRPDPYRENPR